MTENNKCNATTSPSQIRQCTTDEHRDYPAGTTTTYKYNYPQNK
ncbi:MAG TPA: hypothetical protein PK699_06830 [bacterium]|nr:hypothetical protein [bacterium]